MKLLSLLVFCSLCLHANAQIYDTNNITVSTFAGSGFYGEVDGQAFQTMFYNPSAITSDAQGNLFILDFGNGSFLRPVRQLTQESILSTLPIGAANASSVALDHSGNFWLPMSSGYLNKNGIQQTLLNGTITPNGICCDSKNRLYISDSTGNKIWRFDTNQTLSVFVGSGNPGSVDGNGIFNSFNQPTALAIDSADNIYVWDSGNFIIRRVDQSQNVVTVAGKASASSSDHDAIGVNAGFKVVKGMACDAQNNLLLACDTSIRRMTPSFSVTTLAGSFVQRGYTNSIGSASRFDGASGLCAIGSSIFITDSNNQRIRRIDFTQPFTTNTYASLSLNTYPGLQISGILGRSYAVQSSPDLTNWTDRATVILGANPQLWIDQQPLSGSKFYRAVLMP